MNKYKHYKSSTNILVKYRDLIPIETSDQKDSNCNYLTQPNKTKPTFANHPLPF